MQKYTAEIKLAACKEYVEGRYSHREICERYNIYFNEQNSSSMINKWLPRYLQSGDEAFIRKPGNASYTKNLKIQVIQEYLDGIGSLSHICAKYGIPSTTTLRRWIMEYNANRELKNYCPRREIYMAEARRKTTIEERKEIVEYCLSHCRDYKGTASVFDVSYSQVYSWVKKYDVDGEEGLTDKRGHHKTDEEVDELEKLRRENKRLKRQLEENDMLVQLLKKVKEFEGM